MTNITNGFVTTAATANGAVGLSGYRRQSGYDLWDDDQLEWQWIAGSVRHRVRILVERLRASMSPPTATTIRSRDSYSGAASNNAFGTSMPLAGTLSLSDSTLTTTGTQSFGVFTDNGGLTTVNGGSITLTGQDSEGAISTGGSTTNLNGAAVAIAGLGSKGLGCFRRRDTQTRPE